MHGLYVNEHYADCPYQNFHNHQQYGPLANYHEFSLTQNLISSLNMHNITMSMFIYIHAQYYSVKEQSIYLLCNIYSYNFVAIYVWYSFWSNFELISVYGCNRINMESLVAMPVFSYMYA